MFQVACRLKTSEKGKNKNKSIRSLLGGLSGGLKRTKRISV